MSGMIHTPVMLEELMSFLSPPRPDALMADGTLGEGGHAEAFLRAWPALRYVGIDADPRIQAKARERLAPFGGRVTFLTGYFDEVLALPGILPGAPDLVLFDLGVSMHHFLESGRGFGHGRDEDLDMRLSPDAPRSAADILAEESEEEIARIIYEYGEERLSRRIARGIVEARGKGKVATSGALERIVWDAVPASYRHGRIHPATRTFQAIRIAVNDELGRAARGIRLAAGLLAPGGTIAVITFHSLEDRIVKKLFRELSGRHAAGGRLPSEASTRGPVLPIGEGAGARFELLTGKPVEPSADEVGRNPASRSAKLRVARKSPGAGKVEA
jgi:16S rRNA (cytosine1402-N4)-methyltransferase